MQNARSLRNKRKWLLFAVLMVLLLAGTIVLFVTMDESLREELKPFVYVLVPFVVPIYFAARCLASVWTRHSIQRHRRARAGVPDASQ